ncbi:SDR family oxidoreductase [Parapedobacter sp. ISTM3]|uniref:SDR family NAD(P)-dependent oxidoreductase n=1 Tax=Parapedobacter sp. ISTM3 TaxID=2800130 RepID=UPI0019053169|nr:SDR family oxidoreductase [Parapedobacter sp. ISTM3]MBK1442487.1 SDR family oxidoreductase [Parapedobacter sp. ISTM3]
MDFTNKNVVITGGSTGIGFATAKAFINAGASVWITSRSADNLQKAATKINSPKLKTVVSDTSSLEGIAVLEKAVAESGNKVDVLFLNAGIATFAPIEQTSEADFDAQFNTNVKGYFFTLQKLIPHLANGASVLFTSSTVATASQMYGSVYSATKGAVNKIAQVAANELADRKIRVNIVSPGPTQTEGFDKAVPDDDVKKQFATTTALQRMGNPDEIANTVLFLTSDKASFITGTELLVDGGYIGYALK